MSKSPMTEEDHPQDYEESSTPDDERDDGQDDSPGQRVESFSPRRLGYELARDAALRWGVLLLAAAIAVLLIVWNPDAIVMSLALAALAIGAWALLSLASARVTRRLPEITMMMDHDPAAAESVLAQTLAMKPMLRWIRLMLYHRLAVLRHRQGGYAESAAICQEVLGYTLGPAGQSRTSILLMLCEARLECRDPVGTYHALLELYQSRLNLSEALQRLALQTRYEVNIGRHAEALAQTERKVRVAELMPAAQCGAVHALLAQAAGHTQQPRLAQWLWDRTRLLCTQAQVERLHRGDSILGLTHEVEPLAP